MKFLLKISLFLALLIISKLTKESDATTPATDQTKPNAAILTHYDQQGNPLDGLDVAEKKKTKDIHYY
jgi:hypothetical protein